MSKPTSMLGNAVFAQSGGPTAVINSSMAGAVLEAMKHKKVFGKLYGAKNGILGVLLEDMFDFAKEKPDDLKGPEADARGRGGILPVQGQD